MSDSITDLFRVAISTIINVRFWLIQKEGWANQPSWIF